MTILENYKEALQNLYDHVGFEENWVVYPIDDLTDMYWFVNREEIYYSECMEDFKTGRYYSGTICTQRLYEKHIYEGEDYTMIFLDYHVDGMKYFAFFRNNKKIDDPR